LRVGEIAGKALLDQSRKLIEVKYQLDVLELVAA
jgi:hypothetical protein